jgi:hypothetical protein
LFDAGWNQVMKLLWMICMGNLQIVYENL